MTNETYYLALTAALLIKHFLADYQFQTLYMVQNKGRYGHPGGIQHAGVHAAMSLPILVVAGFAPLLSLAICVGEFVIHYHVDFMKEVVSKRLGLTIQDKAYWSLFGLDQLAHQLTYVLMIGVALAF
ncbi:DUF3307 domain-containing protein [Anianabacter salinae]|uniref:DUF3307 domain-containing protein n=1 Tax=Anianabacter salinae TaxID=2851023 RepID=UPI00225E546F|nr:DUF3307 domain-containing protein [Anianabacter salinae]MBV0911772.1 DUF3307 domain-containing protein [Anianabacter salinae]